MRRSARAAYEEIAKGVFQLWRYFSHARRGIIPDYVVRSDAHGVVLTLDTWLMTSAALQQKVLASAAVLALRDNEISAQNRRSVVFCLIADFEATLVRSDEDSLLRVLSAARSDEFAGWALPSIRRETEGEVINENHFRFNLAMYCCGGKH
jgi:hypothetical protein